jgi:hypothetical protein
MPALRIQTVRPVIENHADRGDEDLPGTIENWD